GTAVGTVCRSAQHRIYPWKSIPSLLLLDRLHADARTAPVSSKRNRVGKRTMHDDSIEAVENRRSDRSHSPSCLVPLCRKLSVQAKLPTSIQKSASDPTKLLTLPLEPNHWKLPRDHYD